MRTIDSFLTGILIASLTACAATTGSAEEQPLVCSYPTSSLDQLKKLTVAPDVLRLTLFEVGINASMKPAIPEYFEVTQNSNIVGLIKGATIGTPCTDPSCEEAIKASASNNPARALSTPEGSLGVFVQRPEFPVGRTLIVVSQKTGNTTVVTLDELRPFVAPLETASEALAWASLHLVGDLCKNGQAIVKVSPDLYEIKQEGSSSGCDGTYTYEIVHRIYRDGRIESGTPVILTGAKRMEGCITVGRQPQALLACSAVAPSNIIGDYLARVAHLEGAAVLAFGELANELDRLGVDASLSERARKAQGEELRHEACMEKHASRYHVRHAAPQAATQRYESLFALALHNAQEGCVRETYGALVAKHQAMFAGDDGLRSDMQTIAAEEVSHAAWSHDLDTWLSERLTAREREQVAAAKQQAFDHLRDELNQEVDEQLRLFAGLPNKAVAQRMLGQLQIASRQAIAETAPG
jgi:hypothetical protein